MCDQKGLVLFRVLNSNTLHMLKFGMYVPFFIQGGDGRPWVPCSQDRYEVVFGIAAGCTTKYKYQNKANTTIVSILAVWKRNYGVYIDTQSSNQQLKLKVPVVVQ